MNRRKFLTGAAALFCAPAIVRAGSLMKIWVPPEPRIVTRNSSIYVEYANEEWNNARPFSDAGKSWERPFRDIPQALNIARAGDSIYVTVPPKMDDDTLATLLIDLQSKY